jgi:putative phage-type endonuclease
MFKKKAPVSLTQTLAPSLTVSSTVSLTQTFPVALTSSDLLAIAGAECLRLNPLLYMQPTFEEQFKHALSQTLAPYTNDETALIEDVIDTALDLFYQFVAPPRSFNTTFCRSAVDTERIRAQIQFLQSVPQPEQRTAAWYAFRHEHLTASNIWKAFGTPAARNQLIYEKCQPHQAAKHNGISTETPMHWGQRYEPLSVRLYEEMYGGQISDFGCIPHPKRQLHYLAASPDGINTDERNPRYGRMLEVKNIYNREIDGVPKLEYWVQMQMQMEVCDLDDSDFLETRFKEYETEAEFRADALDDDCSNRTRMGEHKGLILYFMQGDKPFYEYSPLSNTCLTFADLATWETDTMERHTHLSWMKTIYWRLDEVSCVLVQRNRFWFAAAQPVLADLWAIIEKEKVDGFEHRAPAKRVVKEKEKEKERGPETGHKCIFEFRPLC